MLIYWLDRQNTFNFAIENCIVLREKYAPQHIFEEVKFRWGKTLSDCDIPIKIRMLYI
jgi:hypothetical protein